MPDQPSAVPAAEPRTESRGELVKRLVELQDFYLQLLSARFTEMSQDHELFLGKRKDKRKPNEQWRSFSQLGDPYRMTRIETDAWLEIMGSADPPIQCQGRGSEDEWKAKGFEAWGEYMLLANRWTSSQEMLFRNLSVRGWQPMKTDWKEIKFSPIMRPGREQRVAFDEQLNAAMKTGLVSEPPTSQDPAEWQAWHDENSARYPYTPENPSVPPLPDLGLLAPQPQETIIYRGPWIQYPAPWSLRFDPFVESVAEMPVIFQRVVKPRDWTNKQVEAGVFDRNAVAEAGKGGDHNRLQTWDEAIAKQCGLSFNQNDPMYKDSDEFFEVWRPFEPEDQYLIIMNRGAIVNVNTNHPWWHRQNPYHFIKNIPVSGHPFGLSSYHQMRRTFEDRCLFRDLLLDMLVLHGLGVYLKRRGMGLTDMQRMIQPGMILDVPDPAGFSSALGPMTGFSELMQIGQVLLGDQTSLTSTGENVAGQPATVGRVSATEATNRLQQALVPHKKKAERLEEEISAAFPQLYYNVYQKLPTDDPVLAKVRAQVQGDTNPDVFADPGFTRETFAEALRMNIRLRGATDRLDKAMEAQQIKDFVGMIAQLQSASGIPVQIFGPVEIRNLARRYYEALGQKGIDEVITKEGDKIAADLAKAHAISAGVASLSAQTQAVQAQQGLDQLQNPQPPQQEPPPPSMRPNYKDAPPDIKRQMEERDQFQPSQMPEPSPLEAKQMDVAAKVAQAKARTKAPQEDSNVPPQA